MDAKTVVMVVSGLLGGVGLFLYGMTLMSEGLQKTAGNRLKVVLEKLTSNRVIGLIVGTIVTVLVQSSTATTVMVVGFVNAGMMNLAQALSIVLGANIGTTVTTQIIAFKVSVLALPAIGIGGLFFVFSKRTGIQYAAQIVLGFGLLFLGMDTMTSAFAPVSGSPALSSLFVKFSHSPLLGVIVGTVITIVLQSSAATIGITMALATTGLIDFPGAVALMLGDNIGTTITANIAALNGNKTAKQAAFGHFLFNVLGVAVILILFKPFLILINTITPSDVAYMAADGSFPYISRHIANSHTMFNVISALIFLPLLPLLARACELVIKTDKEQDYKFTRLSDAMLSSPEIAASQVRTEVGRMSMITLTMLKDTENGIKEQDKSYSGKIKEYERTLDSFRTEILGFIDKLLSHSLSEKTLTDLERLKQVTHSLEDMGDLAVKLMKATFKMIDKDAKLSKPARKELNQMFDVLVSFATITFNALYTNRVQSEEDLVLEDELDNMHKQFRKNHIKRLNKGLCTVETGIYFVDILNYLEKLGDQVFTVAQINLAHSTHKDY